MLHITSCQKPLPSSMPDLNTQIDEAALNTNISVTVPKEINSLKLENTINLRIDNLSDNVWLFSVKEDILMFRFENNEWKEVQDKSVDLGETELTLDIAGNFPLDSIVIPVSPDLIMDYPIALRIFVLAHEQYGENKTGAFVDIHLKP